jgi:hypothetical protein
MHSLIPDIQYPCGGLLVEGELLTVPGDLHSSPFGEVRVLVSILSSIVRVFVNLYLAIVSSDHIYGIFVIIKRFLMRVTNSVLGN